MQNRYGSVYSQSYQHLYIKFYIKVIQILRLPKLFHLTNKPRRAANLWVDAQLQQVLIREGVDINGIKVRGINTSIWSHWSQAQ